MRKAIKNLNKKQAYYFAFGSNTDTLQVAQRMPEAVVVGVAKLYEYRFAFGGSSLYRGGAVATIIEQADSSVVGVLYSTTEGELEDMDGFEGSEYDRVTVSVRIGDRLVDAYTYKLREPQLDRDVPSSEYMSKLVKGYREHGIPSDQLRDAVSDGYTVFVYGSLKRGFDNHGLLENAVYIGKGQTVERNFTMYSLGAFPGVCRDAKASTTVKGELYQVNLRDMWKLDRLEGHPNFYRRESVMIRRNGKESSAAFMYILPTPKYSSERVERNDWTHAHTDQSYFTRP